MNGSTVSKKNFKNDNIKTITEAQNDRPLFHLHRDVILDTFNPCKYF